VLAHIGPHPRRDVVVDGADHLDLDVMVCMIRVLMSIRPWVWLRGAGKISVRL
jgi:hypothetical protein